MVRKAKPRTGQSVLDGWSALHFLAGAGAALLAVPWHSMLALGIAWEAVEAEFRRRSKGKGGVFEPESFRNMVSDVVMDMLGWGAGVAAAAWLMGWDLALWR